MRNQGTAKAARRKLSRQVRKATGLPLPVAARMMLTHLSHVWYSLAEAETPQTSSTRAALAAALTWVRYEPGCDCCGSGWNEPVLNGPKGSFNYRLG